MDPMDPKASEPAPFEVPSCCTGSLNSFGILHNTDCPRFCTAHLMWDCPDGPHFADTDGTLR